MSCLGLFVCRGQHLQRGTIHKQCCTVLHPFGIGPSQWFQQSGGLPHTIRLLAVSYQWRVVLPSLHLGNSVQTFHARFPQILRKNLLPGAFTSWKHFFVSGTAPGNLIICLYIQRFEMSCHILVTIPHCYSFSQTDLLSYGKAPREVRIARLRSSLESVT